MKTLSLTDRKVRRIMLCMSNTEKRSVGEIAEQYNRHYPPNIIGRMVGIKMPVLEVEQVLVFLSEYTYVHAELLSFTDRPLTIPEKHYWLSAIGMQFLKKQTSPL